MFSVKRKEFCLINESGCYELPQPALHFGRLLKSMRIGLHKDFQPHICGLFVE